MIENDNEGQISEVFQVLSNKSKKVFDYHTDIIEVFTKSVYPNSEKLGKLNFERCNDFSRLTDANLLLIPPSQDGRIENMKRAALQGGLV